MIGIMPNTYDGNMKLQKLLVLADMAHLAQYGQPLFKDDVLALENGLVVEKVRLRYRNDYSGFKADSEKFDPDFSEEEYETLKAVRAYKETMKTALKYEVINGVRFYYDDMTITDDIIAELEKFSQVCEDDAYSICSEDGKLVIF